LHPLLLSGKRAGSKEARMFKAILIEKDGENTRARLAEIDKAALPDGDVTVRISHSTLNYKDGLAITGKGPIVRSFPMVPGVDFAGIVEESSNPRFKAGDAVVLNGFGVGESHWGGLAEYARVKGDWLISLPNGINAARAMALGTAGYTAMLCVIALEREGATPDKGEIIVTGAGGGVGGVAILILAHLGYDVVASTGRPEETDYLKGLGAKTVIDRKELSSPGKPLQKARWAGAVDSVGSHTLANICAQTKENGVVTACGLAQGIDFPSTVAPFILRGVTLVGINSVLRPLSDRDAAWRRLAHEIDFNKLDAMTRTIPLSEAIDAAQALLDGKVRGRLVVDVSK
jgi:acrylyl-CoA reductase (NADPH)